MPAYSTNITEIIKKEARKHGFFKCGLAAACFLEKEAPVFEDWLQKKKNADLSFMAKNFDKRLDPRLLREGTRTVISLAFNYFCRTEQNPDSRFFVARYAHLDDYHTFLKQKMFSLVEVLRKQIGDFEAHCFVDSAPILERAWAAKTGIGWLGRNGSLIIPGAGSFFFMCQILTDLVTDYDTPLKNHKCEDCFKCIVSCPTGALKNGETIDANKCISYLTIEHKGDIDATFKNSFSHQIFGCDICQNVCPHNQNSPFSPEAQPYLNTDVLNFSKTHWLNLDVSTFNRKFKKHAFFRSGFKKIKNNISFVNEK